MVPTLMLPDLVNAMAEHARSEADAAGRDLLTAQKDGTWLAMAATIPFARRSCGYVDDGIGSRWRL